MRQYRQHLHRRDLLLVTAKDFEGLDAKLAPQLRGRFVPMTEEARKALADHYDTTAIPKPAGEPPC